MSFKRDKCRSDQIKKSFKRDRKSFKRERKSFKRDRKSLKRCYKRRIFSQMQIFGGLSSLTIKFIESIYYGIKLIKSEKLPQNCPFWKYNRLASLVLKIGYFVVVTPLHKKFLNMFEQKMRSLVMSDKYLNAKSNFQKRVKP